MQTAGGAAERDLQEELLEAVKQDKTEDFERLAIDAVLAIDARFRKHTNAKNAAKDEHLAAALAAAAAPGRGSKVKRRGKSVTKRQNPSKKGFGMRLNSLFLIISRLIGNFLRLF